ncbi:hypothetical protein IAU60_005973 [Kwoniella sp. DSM 27419]
MSQPIQASMNGSTVANASHRQSKKDWSLPASFLSLLSIPPDVLIPELVPKLTPAEPATPKPEVQPEPEPLPPWAAFIPAMQRAQNNVLTDNGAVAHESTLDPLVDLFFDFAPGMDVANVHKQLQGAWTKDPLTTLRLVFHARSIHEGKGWKEGFLVALGWMWDHHPRTLLENLHLVVDPICQRQRDSKRDAEKRKRQEAAALESDDVLDLDDEGNVDMQDATNPEYPSRPHGSFNDLIELLQLHLANQLTAKHTDRLSAIDEGTAPKFFGSEFKEARLQRKNDPSSKRDRRPFRKVLKYATEAEKKGKPADAMQLKLCQAGHPMAKHKLLTERAKEALTNDKKYQALFITVLNLFVKSIKEDLDLLAKHKDFLMLPSDERKAYPNDSSPHLFGMTYAAKWVPSPGHSGDKQTLFATALAKVLFPNDHIDRSRQRLQREVLAPLRKVLAVPEIAMSDGSWKVDYTKVPSRSMARNGTHFFEHDPKGFDAYLERVKAGRSTISGASLMPHEIMFEVANGKSMINKRIADMQWDTMVASVRNSSTNRLSNCIAVADVSGSMGSIYFPNRDPPSPILPCIALTLLLGELSAAPWAGSFFTFSDQPKFETLDVSLPISERAAQLSKAHWGMSTNFYKVFDMILAVAQRENLRQDQMIQKLFVFSDMQFDQAKDGAFGETEHQTIKRKFEKAGYTMPEMVYWNLLGARQGGVPKPATADMEGVSLFSGYSASLMKFFLGQGEGEDDEGEDDDMVSVGHDGEEVAVEKTEKKKSTPSETVMQVTSAQSLSGLKVVD